MYKRDKRVQKNNLVDGEDRNSSSLMNTLILWNIGKAFEKRSNIDLKMELKEAEALLGQNANLTNLVNLTPLKRHIACAFLAWQQLGHNSAESLYQFYESEKDKFEPKDATFKSWSTTTSPYNIPPALKLPCAESIVLPCTTRNTLPHRTPKHKEPDNKKCPTCCFEPRCDERLVKLDAACKELQQRLGKLAQREAERVMLLERAETTWVQLELEYTRRLQAVIDKEEDIERQIKKLAEERNCYKATASNLVELLKPRGEAAENARLSLREIDDQVCKKACERIKLSESAAKEDSSLAEMNCKQTQQDRDLQFQEEKALRKKALLNGQLEALRGLAYESERAMRAELTGLKEQIKQVSKQLLSEDEKLGLLDKDIAELQQEKDDVAEDLAGCQKKCDDGMQKKIDELLEKKDKIQELRKKVLECQCKVPIDKATQVKRSPSIAGLCQCEPEFKALEGCSCTSLRTRLLSDLLKDLFGGLQSQMGDIAFRMPCQLLKCLENKHSWSKGSNVTMNLTKFFSQLFVDELDIAIVTSIENYHARWVGATCADIVKRPIPDPGAGREIENWQDRAMAVRIETLASEMAEQMFQDKVNDIMAKATEAVTTGPSPCLCKPKKEEVAVYHVQVKPNIAGEKSQQQKPFNASKDVNKFMKPNRDPNSTKSTKLAAHKAYVPTFASTTNKKQRASPTIPSLTNTNQFSSPDTHKLIKEYWQQTQKEIGELRTIIKESFDKKNSVTVDRKFTKYVNRGAITETTNNSKQLKNPSKKKDTESTTAVNKKGKQKSNNLSSYAVNYVCFCGMHRSKPKGSGSLSLPIKDTTKLSKNLSITSENESKQRKLSMPSIKNETSCNSSCNCFNKLPSTTSIDKFLNTLTQWNVNLKTPSNGNEAIEQTFGSLNYAAFDSASKMYDPSKLVCFSDVTNLCTSKGLPNKPSLEANKLFLESLSPFPVANSEYIADVNLDKSDEQCPAVISNKDNKIILQNEIVANSQCINKNSFDAEKYVKEIDSKKSQNQHNTKYVESLLRKPLSQEIFTASHNYNLIPLDRCKMDLEVDNVEKDINATVSPDRVATSQNYNVLHFSRSTIVRVPLDPALELGQGKMECAVEIMNKDSYVHNFHSSQNLLSPLFKRGKFANSENKCSSVNNSQEVVAKNKPTNACDCGYQIKFLGATLASLYSYKSQQKSENKVSNNLPRPIKDVITNIDKITNDICMNNETTFALESNHIDTYERRVQNPICHCSAKIDKINALISSSVQKVEGENIVLQQNAVQNNIDKISTNTNSFIKSNETENCICCIKRSDESRNLEANTFQLLEEYLRRRLEAKGYDKDHIKSYDEEKNISKMFKRLKYAITELTNQAKCKCEEEVNEKGSWLRAYNLLQEYLKIKISRVQCTCSPFEENNKMQSMLPELTEKVCRLIENDFERLMECQNVKQSSNANVDTINPEDASEDTLKRKSFFALIQKDFLVSISAQVLPNQDSVSAQIIPKLDDKSCEVELTEYTELKTVETQKSDIINLMKDILNQSTQYSNPTNQELKLTSTKNSESSLSDITSKTKEEHSKINTKANEEENSGEHYKKDFKCHTLDSTDFDERQENRAKITEIWNKHIKNKESDRRTVSYIMDSVNKNTKYSQPSFYVNDKNINKEESHWYMSNTQPLKCDTKTSPFEISEFMLNDSIENIKKSLKRDKTSTSLKNRILKIDDDKLYIASSPQISDEMSMKKSVHFPPLLQRNVNEQTEEALDDAHISSSKCVCGMVPLCHVKMLINNIETKLKNSDCTCDSLMSSVCPVHGSDVQSNTKECLNCQ